MGANLIMDSDIEIIEAAPRPLKKKTKAKSFNKQEQEETKVEIPSKRQRSFNEFES